jgi:hypothetical protein
MVNNSFTSNFLIILLWNCNGILNHVNELIVELHEKIIDIALISESHLTERSKLNIPDYHLTTSHHQDGTTHAGSAILVRTPIHFNSLPNTTENYLQDCAIFINLNHTPITIAAAYCPPRHNITTQQFKQFLTSLGHNFIVGGDFNAKHLHWGCRTSRQPKSNIVYHLFKKKKTPGFDLVTYEVARHLPRKTLILLTYIFNAILRLSHFSLQWKFSIIVVIPKPGKPPDSPISYRSISLFPFFSKVLEKLILKRITSIISNSRIIQNTQFGFRNFHYTTHQTNRITDTITASPEKKAILNRSLSSRHASLRPGVVCQPPL